MSPSAALFPLPRWRAQHARKPSQGAPFARTLADRARADDFAQHDLARFVLAQWEQRPDLAPARGGK